MTFLSGGRSNLTFLVTDGVRQWVLRRPPVGQVVATAHDMWREYRVLKALQDTPVPVPRVVGMIEGHGLFDTPFYIMHYVPGLCPRTEADMRSVGADRAPTLARSFVESIAEVHLLDPEARGLTDFGRPNGYLERQLTRWRRQLESSSAGRSTGLLGLGEILGARVPVPQRTTLVHGDPRLDNALVGADGRVVALLDWEMSTLGDPLADLGLLSLYWEGWGGLDNPIAATPAEQPGYPPFADLLGWYEDRVQADMPDLAWYRAFAFFKFGAICHGIAVRHENGQTVGDGFEGIGAMVPALVARGQALMTPAAGAR